MYKVILAEDEMLVRLGLKNSVPWSKYDMEVVADEDNGAAALEKFRTLKPDLIITDLKMNGMSGIELIQEIRAIDKDCLIVVVSCMDDFATLREMMKFELLGYILKASMTMTEIDEVLQKAFSILEERTDKNPSVTTTVVLKKLLLQEYLISENADVNMLVESFKAQDYQLPTYKFFTIFHIAPLNKEPMNRLGLSFMENVVSENLPKSDVIILSNEYIVALHSEEITESINVRLSRITHTINSFFDVSLRIFSQKISGQLTDLPSEVGSAARLYQMNELTLSSGDQTIRKAADYILSHYNENLTLNILSSYVNLSPNYFSALFKKETGLSFINYLNDIRVEKAKFLLQSTDDYLYNISELVGFNTFEYFSQVFKQKIGTSPGEWRKHLGR